MSGYYADNCVFFITTEKKKGKKGFFLSKEVLLKHSDYNEDQITLRINSVVTSVRLYVYIHVGTRAYSFQLSSNLSLLCCEMPCNYIV